MPMTVTTNATNPESDLANKLTKEQELVVETPPTTNDSSTAEENVVVAVAMATTSSSPTIPTKTTTTFLNKSKLTSQNQKKKLNSRLNVDRCVVCFKLVKNLKGNKLCQYYDLSSAYPVKAKTAKSSFDFEINSNHDSSSDQHDLLGEPAKNNKGPLDLNNNHVNSKNRSSDLVKEADEEGEEEEGMDTCYQVINKKSSQLYAENNFTNHNSSTRTIGDVLYESVRAEISQQLLAKNSACLKKVCEACYRHVCLIDYHIKSAGHIMDLVGLKMKRSNGLLTGQATASSSLRMSRALSACSSKVAAAESLVGDGVSGDLVDLLSSQNETRLFNKRKVIDTRNSPHNTLTKVAKNESSLKLNTCKNPDNNSINSNSSHSSATKIPINNLTNIANSFTTSNNTNTNHTNNSNGSMSDQSLRNSTISHIENLLKNADPQTLSQMQRLAQSASLLQNGFVKNAAAAVKQANLNHNFKSINNNSNHSNNNSSNNVSSFTAFSNRAVNFNKNELNANQEAKASRNDLSDLSESSYKSNQYEQKQQEQEIGSRRKRKSINPSRLMKDNLTNDVDIANKNSGEQQANFAKKGGLLQNGHSAFERRHHSADSFQQQQQQHHQEKLVNSQKTAGFKAKSTTVQQQQGNKGRKHIDNNNNRVKKAAIDYDSIDQSARALLLLSSEKENGKLNGVLFSHQDKQQGQRQGQDVDEEDEEEECNDKSDGPSEYIEQNGINCDVEEEEDANEHLMNESEHDLSEVSAVGGNYIHDDEVGDEHHPTMDPDETDSNEIDIDIDEVEADAEDEDELDENEQDTEDEEDCGSVENDENHHQFYNGFHRAYNHTSSHNNKPNSSNLQRQKLDLTNGSTINHNNNKNKPTKKIFNIKNEMYKSSNKSSASNMLNRQNNMSDFNQQKRHIGGAAGLKNFAFNNTNISYKNQNKSELQQQQFSKNGHGGANVVKSSKKFSVKSESVSRNTSHNNGSYYNSLNYDESSNHSKSNQNFVSPSLSDSPSPSQMADLASPHSRSLNSSYLSCINGSGSSTKHACEVCNKTFKTQNILRQHMRIHTGDKPFVCDICTKAFSQMASLKYHLATHSDARPYRCEVCSKTFKLKPPFKKHVKECQPRAASHQAYHHQQASSPSGSQFNYFNSSQFNVNSNGLELDANEDDID